VALHPLAAAMVAWWRGGDAGGAAVALTLVAKVWHQRQAHFATVVFLACCMPLCHHAIRMPHCVYVMRVVYFRVRFKSNDSIERA